MRVKKEKRFFFLVGGFYLAFGILGGGWPGWSSVEAVGPKEDKEVQTFARKPTPAQIPAQVEQPRGEITECPISGEEVVASPSQPMDVEREVEEPEPAPKWYQKCRCW